MPDLFDWTPERVDHLRTLLGEGHSCRTAASVLGTTKSKVEWQAKVIGVRSTAKGIAGFKPTRRSTLSGQPVEVKQPRPPLVFGSDDPAAYPRAVTLAEVREGQCRWIIGDPKGPNTLFCGEPFTVTDSGPWYCAACLRRTRSASSLAEAA